MIHFSKISNGKAFLDGLIYFKTDVENKNWKKELYKKLSPNYPKFYKMDANAKLVFLCSELLKNKVSLEKSEADISILMGSKSGSLETDIEFQNSYQNGNLASPSIFVYTLPNIAMGELAIRNKLYGENLSLIVDSIEEMPYLFWVNKELKKGAKGCLCVWVEKKNENEECFIFFTNQLLDAETIYKINETYNYNG